MSKDALGPAEEIALAEIYFLALRGGPADEIFRRYLDRDDHLGRLAWQRHQQILFRAREMFDEAERGIIEFRRRFAAVPEDPAYTSQMVMNQANRYRDLGNHERVVELILDDVRDLPPDLPIRSFNALGVHFQSFVAEGRADEARALLERHRDALSERIAADSSRLPPASEVAWQARSHKEGVVHRDRELGVLEDIDTFDSDVVATQIAKDRLRAIEDMLARMSPTSRGAN